jgi:serine/threonine protein kinase
VGALSKSIFCKAALKSGLVSKSDLDEALGAVLCPALPPRKSAPDVSDEQLAAKLVEMGKLNKWQAQQLIAGRTKFTLGDYVVVDSIGRGGMGDVFKAQHAIMRRTVAIKLLPRDKSNPEAIASFHREIQALAQLDDANLVRAFDARQEGSRHFLVTEYVPGIDLRKYIKKNGKLSMRAAAAIISQAARGLQHAHERGLIHRDIKPGNLMITPDGHVKVLDLGLAGYFNTSDDEMRDIYDGRIVGTADYLAPEHITDPQQQGPASDIYALGCTLYYAVTAKVPFPGGTTREKARRHCMEQPLNPRVLNAELTDEFVEVIGDMMAKDPKERIGSGEEVIRRLAPWAGSDWRESAREVGAAAEAASKSNRRVPQVAVPGAPKVADTNPELDGLEAIEFVEEVEEEGTNQSSQTTHPMASAEQETSWSFDLRPRLTESGLSLGVIIMVAMGLLTAVVVLTAVLISAFR